MTNTVNVEIPEQKMKLVEEYDIDVQKLFDKSLNMKINRIKEQNPSPELPDNILQRIQKFHTHVNSNKNLIGFHEGLPHNGVSIAAMSKGKSYYIDVKISNIDNIPNLNISNTLSNSGLFLNEIGKQLINAINEIDKDVEVEFKLIEHELAEHKYDRDNIKFRADIKPKSK